MKRYIITALCAFVAYCAWGQLNNPCFRIPIPENTPSTYTLHNFTQDSATVDLDNSLLYALAISGNVTLTSENNSSVKVILIDNNGIQHLVYEINSLLADTNNFEITNVGRESMWDNPVYASKLLVRLKNATLTLNAITPVTELLPNAMPQQRALRMQEQNDTIVAILNRNLIARDIPWRAGVTTLSEDSYEMRRSVLGDDNPFYNIEYYIGGYYVDPAFDATQATAVDDGYVEEFEWRNRHGKNWMTAPRQQKYNSCWAFAPVATIEAYLNLYYNDTINIDISEQQFQPSCINTICTHMYGGYSDVALNAILDKPLVTESCYPYKFGHDEDVCNICEDPDTTVTIHNFTIVYNNELFDNTKSTNLKSLLLESPVCLTIWHPWWHSMMLCGYKKISVRDTIFYPQTTHAEAPPIIINSNSPYIGQTAWLFKNSASWWKVNGERIIPIGFQYVILSNLNIDAEVVADSISCSFFTKEDIICSDADNDGYYFWGIGDKPAHCPVWAPNTPDGDDSNPLYGAMDEYGFLQEIGPHNKSPLIVSKDRAFTTPQIIDRDITITSGATLTITSYLTMHPDAKILIQGGKLVLDGGTIRNGYIRNKGSLVIKNDGVVEMCGDDQYEHNPDDLEIINTGLTPFPITTTLKQSAFKRVNR